jgi:hypothetical protein
MMSKNRNDQQQTTIAKADVNHLPNSIHPGDLFTLSDAEKLLGESAHLNDSASKIKGADPEYIDSMSIVKRDAATI